MPTRRPDRRRVVKGAPVIRFDRELSRGSEAFRSPWGDVVVRVDADDTPATLMLRLAVALAYFHFCDRFGAWGDLWRRP